MLVLLAGCSDSDERTLDFYDDARTVDAAVATDGYFVDPQGTYELEVDPNWLASHGAIAAEIELWFIGEIEDEVASNVNLLTQAAPGFDLDTYIDFSIRSAPSIIDDFTLIDTSVIPRDSKPDLGVMEFTGDGLHFLAIFFLENDQAMLATLTTTDTKFEELRAAVEPYLLTLQPIGS